MYEYWAGKKRRVSVHERHATSVRGETQAFLVVVFLTGTDKSTQTVELRADVLRAHVVAADGHVGGGGGVHAEVLLELLKREQRDAELRRRTSNTPTTALEESTDACK